MPVINAHLHLNGSVSKKYLKDASVRNQCEAVYESFESEQDIWRKFGLIHKMIQTNDDIRLAVVDVVQNTTADILEIRTTPKALQGQSIEQYIEAFLNGLSDAQSQFPSKQARGLLSIDRSKHTLNDAKWIIDAAVSEKKKSGMIVGIDLSGNFLADRTLTGRNLYEAIKYALSQDIGLALHVGEIDSEIERTDFDWILKAISEFKGEIHGKVRLGHAIYRTEEQNRIIGDLQIPIEICPTCHRHLGWLADQPHPILNLYKYRSQVIPGDDDSILFDCNAKGEQEQLDSMMAVSPEISELTPDEQDKQIFERRKRYLF